MEDKIKEDHDKAWELLDDLGVKLGAKLNIRASFASINRDEYPFIEIKWKEGEIEYYKSTHKLISHYAFHTKHEVIMANALYENMRSVNPLINPNEFIHNIKYIFRVIKIESDYE